MVNVALVTPVASGVDVPVKNHTPLFALSALPTGTIVTQS